MSKQTKTKTLIPILQTQRAAPPATAATNVLPAATKAATREKMTKWSIRPRYRSTKITNPQPEEHHNQMLSKGYFNIFHVFPKQCNGGPTMERSLSVRILKNGYAAASVTRTHVLPFPLQSPRT